MNVNRYIAALITSFFSLSLFAQVAKEDFRKIDLAYKNASSVSMNVKYSAFANYTTVTPLDIQTGEIKYRDGQSYHKIGHIEIIQNKGYTLNIDHQDKKIYLLEKKTIGKSSPFQIPLDTLLKMTDEVTYTDLPKGKASYDIVFPSAEYAKVKIVYDKKTFFIEKMILYFLHPQDLTGAVLDEEATEIPRLEIEYTAIQTNIAFPASQFTYDKFLKFLGNRRYVCKDEFKAYALIHDNSFKPY